jgi:phosphatidylinositol alpha-1,6-mannosyltransferase
MKKSLLLTLEFPPQRGGTQKYYSDICSALPSDKIVVLTNVAEVNNKSVQYKIYRQNLIVNYFFPKWLPMIWWTWQIVRKEKIELIQVGQVLPCGTVALMLKKILKIPYVVYTHGLDILLAKKNSRKKRLMKKILNNADKIISNSEFVKNEVVKLGIEQEKVVVVYPTIQIGQNQESRSKNLSRLDVDQEKIQEKYGLFGKKILLSVCRLVDRKGIDLVILALEKIQNQIPDLVYVVVGDGPKKAELEKLAGKNIIFTGRVDDEELSVLYSLADVFILTPKKSDYDIEGFGIVYLEANSYGKPVIGSKMSGIEEAVADGVSGILIEPDNIEQISEAILKLYNDEELRKKLGEQGKNRVERDFLMENQIQKIKKMLYWR